MFLTPHNYPLKKIIIQKLFRAGGGFDEDNRRSSEMVPGEVTDVPLKKKQARFSTGTGAASINSLQSSPSSSSKRKPIVDDKERYIIYQENIAAPYKERSSSNILYVDHMKDRIIVM